MVAVQSALGYAVACCGALDWMWMSMLVGWLFKWLTLKYGGMTMYRRTVRPSSSA